jgi:hypothetical protein
MPPPDFGEFLPRIESLVGEGGVASVAWRHSCRARWEGMPDAVADEPIARPDGRSQEATSPMTTPTSEPTSRREISTQGTYSPLNGRQHVDDIDAVST